MFSNCVISDCQEEGLFRKTGSVIRQAELRALLCAGEIVDLHQGEFSVHDCASVLKSYLHEMEEPLLTQALFQPFMKVVGGYKACLHLHVYRSIEMTGYSILYSPFRDNVL